MIVHGTTELKERVRWSERTRNANDVTDVTGRLLTGVSLPFFGLFRPEAPFLLLFSAASTLSWLISMRITHPCTSGDQCGGIQRRHLPQYVGKATTSLYWWPASARCRVSADFSIYFDHCLYHSHCRSDRLRCPNLRQAGWPWLPPNCDGYDLAWRLNFGCEDETKSNPLPPAARQRL